jgi:hypothetical protein
MVESPAEKWSGRFPDRAIRRQTGPARRSRRIGILFRFSAGRRIWPAPRPGHPAADRTSPAGPPDQCSECVSGGVPDPPGGAAGPPARCLVPPDLPPGRPAQRPAAPDLSPDLLLSALSNGQIHTYLYIPLLSAGVGLELHQPLFILEALTYPHWKNTKFHRSPLLANQSS